VKNLIVWHWIKYRILGRCFVCGRLMIVHSPWAKYLCERTPLPIEITDKGRQLAAELEAAQQIPAA
jgi:hypothetical protein